MSMIEGKELKYWYDSRKENLQDEKRKINK